MRNAAFQPDYAAVRHILTSPVIETRTAPYIKDDDFDWEGLLTNAESMSGGERTLVRIAYDLWEAKGVACLWEIPRKLDQGNFERVLEALWICRGDAPYAKREIRAA